MYFTKQKDLYFEAMQKRFCLGCIRHFCEKFCSLLTFADFCFGDFTVNN